MTDRAWGIYPLTQGMGDIPLDRQGMGDIPLDRQGMGDISLDRQGMGDIPHGREGMGTMYLNTGRALAKKVCSLSP